MSVWGDIRKRSNGDGLTKEEFTAIYPGGDEKTILQDAVNYKDYTYTIGTSGSFPFIAIKTINTISVFSGYQIIKLKNNSGKNYNLDRGLFDDEKNVIYTYQFNKDDDYVVDEHDGKIYSINEMDSIAKELIDLIIKSENELINHKD